MATCKLAWEWCLCGELLLRSNCISILHCNNPAIERVPLFHTLMLKRQAMSVWRNIEVPSCNHCCSRRTISITYSKCVFVALGIQHEMRMPVLLYNIFLHYLTKGMIFEKRLLNIKCMCRISLRHLSETFFVLSGIERDMVKNVYWSSCKVLVILAKC
jgi:hypothetical protein